MFGQLPLTSLRAMEAVVRTGSIMDAAYELSVTPGAISRQVRELEAQLRARLFDRVRGVWRPTARGKALAAEVGIALRSIRLVVDGLHLPDPVSLRVGVSRALAFYIISPRLPEFLSNFPSISLYIQADRLGERPSADLDVVIRFAVAEATPGFTIIPLTSGRIFPAAAPSLLSGDRPQTPEQWPDVPRLSFLPLDHWAEWQRATNLSIGAAPNVHFSDSAILFEAMAAGAGLSMAHSILCHRYLEQGAVVPIGSAVNTELGYFAIVMSQRTKALDAFLDWLAQIMAEAEAIAETHLNGAETQPAK